MLTKNTYRMGFAIFILISNIPTNAAAVNETLPGQPLTDVGKFLNKPHVELTGKVINNLARKLGSDIDKVKTKLDINIGDVAKDLRSEMADVAKEICRLHPCTEWSEWKQCIYTTVKGYGNYGKQKRTRNCGFNTTLCKRYSTDRNIEDEFRTCNNCGESYTVTQHGYCIKFVKYACARNAAVSKCKADGGHLIHIDSDNKFQDVIAFASKMKLSGSFRIDGYRAAGNREWQYENKPSDPSFMRWYPGKPTAGLYLILIYSGSGNAKKWYMYDENAANRPFMCEVYS